MSQRQSSGFTLIECIAVLAVLVALMSVCIPGVTNWIQRNELATTEAELERIIAESNRMAIHSGVKQFVEFDPQSRRLTIKPMNGSRNESRKTIDDPATMSLRFSSSVQIQFFSSKTQEIISGLTLSPDGTISPGRIRILHSSGMDSLWRTHRQTGSIRPVNNL
jgi:prepilin-type N-terminal cleavage/methylation domain-containing protein